MARGICELSGMKSDPVEDPTLEINKFVNLVCIESEKRSDASGVVLESGSESKMRSFLTGLMSLLNKD